MMVVVVREGGRVSGGDGGPNGASAGENLVIYRGRPNVYSF